MRRLKIHSELSEVELEVTGLKHPIGTKCLRNQVNQGRLQIIAKTRLKCSVDHNSTPNDLSAVPKK